MLECFGDQSVTSTFLPASLARFRHSVSVIAHRIVSSSSSSAISTFFLACFARFRQSGIRHYALDRIVLRR